MKVVVYSESRSLLRISSVCGNFTEKWLLPLAGGVTAFLRSSRTSGNSSSFRCCFFGILRSVGRCLVGSACGLAVFVDRDARQPRVERGHQVTCLAKLLTAHSAASSASSLSRSFDIALDHLRNTFARVNNVDDGTWTQGLKVLDEGSGVTTVRGWAVDALCRMIVEFLFSNNDNKVSKAWPGDIYSAEPSNTLKYAYLNRRSDKINL